MTVKRNYIWKKFDQFQEIAEKLSFLQIKSMRRKKISFQFERMKIAFYNILNFAKFSGIKIEFIVIAHTSREKETTNDPMTFFLIRS